MNAQSNIVELINVGYDVTWVAWGVQYFFLIALSYGAFLLTLPFKNRGWFSGGRTATRLILQSAFRSRL